MTNEELRDRTGTVQSKDKLVSFLYLLMRDEVVAGKVEELVRKSEGEGLTTFTNGYLARYAEILSDRLKL